MSLTQTYFLAHTARAKLSKEASRADHNLRHLVGHANLLDGLMIDLVEAERSQEALFNTAARSAKSSHIEWAKEPSRQPTITEDYEEEDSDSDSEVDDDEEEDEEPTVYSAIRRPITSTMEVSQDEDDQATDDEEDDYDNLVLVRTPSRHSPPELLHESDDDSDEDSLPPSPPAPDMRMSFPPVSGNKKRSETISNAFYEEGFYVPQRSTVSVY